jgi:mevalonate pyrophosphate decarboxylase
MAWGGGENSISLAFGPSDRGLYDCLHCCIVVAANATSLTATANGIDISADRDIFKDRLTQIERKYQEVEA